MTLKIVLFHLFVALVANCKTSKLDLLVGAQEYEYNMIHCESDIWCYTKTVADGRGNMRSICESVDKVPQPNYIERGILQIMNYARLFHDEFEIDYDKTFDESCNEVPVHPLWELRGATEYGHFNSVASRDCSTPIKGHDTCKDYCYENAEESQDAFKLFESCGAGVRKAPFEWALKDDSYKELTGNRKIQFQAEAICGAWFPCVDGGHCGAIFKQSRFFTGVGRALGTTANPNPRMYLQGTRTYEFNPDVAGQLQYWKKYSNFLYRIPSGSHYQKCVLDRNCNGANDFQTIVFQMTYAHYGDEWVENTAKVYIDGQARSMTLKHRGTGSEGQHWAVFEYSESPYPDTCKKYHFTINAINNDSVGVIINQNTQYALPQNTEYQFATTGNGCDVNHYIGSAINCGLSFPTPTAVPTPTTNDGTIPTKQPLQPINSSPDPNGYNFQSITSPFKNLCLLASLPSIYVENPIVITWECKEDDNELWAIDDNGHIRSKIDTTRCLGIIPTDPSSTSLRLYKCNDESLNLSLKWEQNFGRIVNLGQGNKCISWADKGWAARVQTCQSGSIHFFWFWG